MAIKLPETEGSRKFRVHLVVSRASGPFPERSLSLVSPAQGYSRREVTVTGGGMNYPTCTKMEGDPLGVAEGERTEGDPWSGGIP